jgi:hypothetical protein
VDQLAAVMRRLELRTYVPGASIIAHGDPADRFYIITKSSRRR